MSSKIVKLCVAVSVAAALSACSTMTKVNGSESPSDIQAKELLYQSTHDQRALIALYRDSLKQHENAIVRYKLAESYYKVGDSRSSQLYLNDLMNQSLPADFKQKVMLLSIKNKLQQGQFSQAITDARSMTQQYSNNAEAYNLLGIAHAKMGNYDKAREGINKARQLFLNDTQALNNLATVDILQGNYQSAVDTLLPQYLNGVREERMLHNLVLALVKSGDKKYAEDIIRKEDLSKTPDSLIHSLEMTNYKPQ